MSSDFSMADMDARFIIVGSPSGVTLAPEAIKAAGQIGNARRDIGVPAVTSADRLNADWHAATSMRKRGHKIARSHIEHMLDNIPRHCLLITVIDGHPATLTWLGGVAGHRTVSLGVEHFGQTGTVETLYRHFGIDAQAIVTAASELSVGRKIG
jgi:pyruvate dehydrogenase E1 component